MNESSHSVVLSYASQDTEAAWRICQTLRASGVDVWFDQSELVGGDQWDAKIRNQIATCALFLPIISASTQARLEGYFRIEWKLAARRTHAMAEEKMFILPIVIDDTREPDAMVPAEFRAVQWTRLPGGEVPPSFCARVKKLLAGEAEPARLPPLAKTAGDASPAKAKSTRPGWFVAGLAAGALVLLGGWGLWRSRERTVATATMDSAPVPPTEAQRLVAKARAIFEEGDELNRETYTLPEDLLKQAEQLDVTEAAAWALHAEVSAKMISYGTDRSAARRADVQSQINRALKLAPNAPGTQLAAAIVQTALAQDRPEAQRRLQTLAEREPGNWRIWRELSINYGFVRNADEALKTVNHALQLAPDEPRIKAERVNLLRLNNRFADADRALIEGMRGATNARLLTFDAWFRIFWRGDLKGAVASVHDWPAWLLTEDRGVAVAGLVYLWSGETTRALEIFGNFPRDYVRDTLCFTGPRAVLTAWAQEEAGNLESARDEWRIVQHVAERELAAEPDNRTALHWKAWALARLDDRVAADGLLLLLGQKFRAPSSFGELYVVGDFAGLQLTLGQTTNALTSLAGIKDTRATAVSAFPKSFLTLNPIFKPLHGDARFQALIDAADGP